TWIRRAKRFLVDVIELPPVVDVSEINGHRDDVVERGAPGSERAFHVRQDLPHLALDVVPGESAGARIARHLTGAENKVAGADHRRVSASGPGHAIGEEGGLPRTLDVGDRALSRGRT